MLIAGHDTSTRAGMDFLPAWITCGNLRVAGQDIDEALGSNPLLRHLDGSLICWTM